VGPRHFPALDPSVTSPGPTIQASTRLMTDPGTNTPCDRSRHHPTLWQVQAPTGLMTDPGTNTPYDRSRHRHALWQTAYWTNKLLFIKLVGWSTCELPWHQHSSWNWKLSCCV